jgi:hypothetical protein
MPARSWPDVRLLDAADDDPCPLEAPDPFAGPAIGATKAAGTCSEGDVCEAYQ